MAVIFRLPIILVFLAALLCACNGSTIDKEAEAQALMQLSRQWSELVASGDLETGDGLLGR